MNTDISSACRCFGLFQDEKIIGFCGVLHQPHGVVRNLKRCSRIVILPDYQGIGLGTRFLETIADYYTKKGFRFSIVTSAKNMIEALNKSSHWKMKRWSVSNCGNKKSKIDYHRKSIRTNCKTASFFYEKNNVEKEYQTNV